EIIARSQGDADRFLSVYRAFKVAQDVTVQRLYLETMEEILKSSTKVIIDKSAEGGSGVLPYLPLPALGSNQGTAGVLKRSNSQGGRPGTPSPASGVQRAPPTIPPLRGRQ